MEQFWAKGLTATSLDDLAEAMTMNRPSLYNAFGDKEALYRRASSRFTQWIGRQLGEVLFAEADLKKALQQFYDKALNIYYSTSPPGGCFVTCTAPVEAATHQAIKKDFNDVIKEVDTVLEKRLIMAQDQGQWPNNHLPDITAKLLHATLQSLALRARAGESRAALKPLYLHAIDLCCSKPGA